MTAHEELTKKHIERRNAVRGIEAQPEAKKTAKEQPAKVRKSKAKSK